MIGIKQAMVHEANIGSKQPIAGKMVKKTSNLRSSFRMPFESAPLDYQSTFHHLNTTKADKLQLKKSGITLSDELSWFQFIQILNPQGT